MLPPASPSPVHETGHAPDLHPFASSRASDDNPQALAAALLARAENESDSDTLRALVTAARALLSQAAPAGADSERTDDPAKATA